MTGDGTLEQPERLQSCDTVHSPLQRAYLVLPGLTVADAPGGFFEFAGRTARQRIADRWLPGRPWRWTDDSQARHRLTLTGFLRHTIVRTGPYTAVRPVRHLIPLV